MSTSSHDMRNDTNADHRSEHNIAADPATVDGSESSESPPVGPETVTLRVVFQHRRGRLYLHGLSVLVSDTGEDVMMKLRAMFAVEVSSFRSLRGRPVFPWKPVVEIATLSSVSEYI
jgi:hypothetical protein